MKYIAVFDLPEHYKMGCAVGKDAAGVAVRIIEDLPPADVEPVRHGYWKVVSDSYGGKAYRCRKS